MKLLYAILVLVLWVTPAFAQESSADPLPERDIGAEPLQTSARSLGGIFRLEYAPVPSTRLGAGNASIGLDATHSNYWIAAGFPPNGKHGLLFDMAVTEWTYQLQYGVHDTWDLSVNFRVMSVWGGFLDETIEWFHGFFNLHNFQREEFPRGNVLFIDSRIGAAHIEKRSFLNDVVVESRWSPVKQVSFINQFRFPVDDFFGGFGALVAAQLHHRVRDFGLTIGLGVSWHEDEEFFLYSTNAEMGFFYVGFSGRLESNTSLNIGFHTATAVFEHRTKNDLTVWWVDDASIEIHFGFRWLLTRNVLVEIAAIENFVAATSADIAFNLSITVLSD